MSMSAALRGGRLVLRVASAVAAIPAAVLAVGVLLLYVPTHHQDVIVRAVFRVDRHAAGAFGQLFAFKSAKASVGLDWVVAALAWLLFAAMLRAAAARLPARLPGRGRPGTGAEAPAPGTGPRGGGA